MQKTKLERLFFCIMFILSIYTTQAQHYYTNESGLNALVFTNKNDLKLACLFPSPNQGGKILLGYSPFNHLSIEAGFISTNIEYEKRQIAHAFNGKNYSANLGYYNQFIFSPSNREEETEAVKPRKISLNTSVKIGYTYGNMDSEVGRFESRFIFQKLFAQIGLGFENRLIGFNFHLKYNRLNFLKGVVIMPSASDDLLRNAQALEKRDHFNMIESKIRVHFCYGFAKAVLGMAFEFNIDGSTDLNFLERGYPYFGLVLELNKIKSVLKKKSRDSQD